MDELTETDSRHKRETLMMLRMAITNGWKIPDSIMNIAPIYAATILREGTTREKLRAMEVLIRMRDSNVAALQVGDKIERLDGGAPTEIYQLGKIEL